MRSVRLGRTGVQVPAVSLGTWGYSGPWRAGGTDVGWTGHDEQQARAALERAYDLGITHWDTADSYGGGHSEQLIGTVWDRVPRDRIFLASKVGWDPGPYEGYYHPEQVRRQVEGSLRNLRTDVIDLYYLHHCNFGPGDARLDDALAILRKARDDGKIRFIGLSDWRSSAIMRVIDRVDPDVVQPYRNVVDDDYASSGLQAWVEENDAGVAFFSPLRHGLLLGKYADPPHFGEGDFRNNVPGFFDRAVLASMRENRALLEARFSKHPQPVLHGLVDALLSGVRHACVLLGMRNPGQVEAAATLGEPLPAEDARWVKGLYREP